MRPIIGLARGLTGHPAALQDLFFSYCWLEAPLDACLARLSDVPKWQDLTVWPSGRVFGELGEYRWQYNVADTLHAVLLLEDGLLPEVFGSGLSLQQGEESNLILWGEWVDPQKDLQANPNGGPLFFANAIPRAQTYPLDLKIAPEENQTARLVIRRYRAINEDEGEFLRCVGFTIKGKDLED